MSFFCAFAVLTTLQNYYSEEQQFSAQKKAEGLSLITHAYA
jgi:hypothetical protein